MGLSLTDSLDWLCDRNARFEKKALSQRSIRFPGRVLQSSSGSCYDRDMHHHQALCEHVIYLLEGGGAHLDFETAVFDLPAESRGRKPDILPHTAWELVEHMRLCQWDILEYCCDPKHVSPEFPEGYWPSESAPANDAAWESSLESFRRDLASMRDLVNAPHVDLLAPIPHGEKGHTILREALLIVDHNAYHLGQLVIVRKALGVWD